MSGGIIAAISLLVGGIGIMNIMLASINERIREIAFAKLSARTGPAIFLPNPGRKRRHCDCRRFRRPDCFLRPRRFDRLAFAHRQHA